ncbi:aldo/keto reductase [Actinomadura sp. CNU-125]|uniref:aldo/keto reductase n=1 Tax=Actinomadura sp. CNU-125 TaxID=1904961 RepID=UPI000A7DBF8E|nr:aldo/keto reductase [Actinomadura sp. CNU-125]
MSLTLDDYRLLGRSGLRVSPLALGTATFGTEHGWGAEKDETRKLFDTYVERGGNFIDTANTYTDGSAERQLGEFTRGDRESLVLATKYTTLRRPGDPNSAGSHRKSMFASVEASLRRLNTDYLDLLYLHVWDFTTPVEEILRGLDDLVRQGKVLYVAMSNVPAWEISRMQAIADLRGWSPLVGLQIEYNLVSRDAERDLIPMARTMGLGVTPYSPLAGGVLTGKYGRADLTSPAASEESSRKSFNAGLGLVTERNLGIATR